MKLGNLSHLHPTTLEIMQGEVWLSHTMGIKFRVLGPTFQLSLSTFVKPIFRRSLLTFEIDNILPRQSRTTIHEDLFVWVCWKPVKRTRGRLVRWRWYLGKTSRLRRLSRRQELMSRISVERRRNLSVAGDGDLWMGITNLGFNLPISTLWAWLGFRFRVDLLALIWFCGKRG